MAKSARLRTCTLFSFTDSVVKLLGALSCARRRYGPVAEAGTLKESEKLNSFELGSFTDTGP